VNAALDDLDRLEILSFKRITIIPSGMMSKMLPDEEPVRTPWIAG
jgi:hypothetical protein